MGSARTTVWADGQEHSFRADLRDEFRRVFRSPWDDLITVAVNAALVTALWFLLPQAVKDWLFVLQGPAAFAIVLETWMLADVPATNMIGKDVDTMVPALDDPPRLQQLLRAKSITLSLLVGIPSAVVSILIGIYANSDLRGFLLACVLLALPFGASSIAAWLGIVIPYRPLPLRWRWAHRSPWRATIRWASLVTTPFLLVPIVSCLLLAPAILVGLAIGRNADGRMTTTATVAATMVACALSAIAFVVDRACRHTSPQNDASAFDRCSQIPRPARSSSFPARKPCNPVRIQSDVWRTCLVIYRVAAARRRGALADPGRCTAI